MRGRFIAVVGPSGVGKDSVMEALAEAEPHLVLARRVITRGSEAGGEAFDGVAEAEFAVQQAAGTFALAWQAHGLRYGIPVSVEAQLAEGRDVMANLSRGVLVKAQVRFERCIVLALSADREVLRARLMARGRETPAEIETRLERAGFALPSGVEAHVLDNSGALAETVAAARAILYPLSGNRWIS